MDSLLMNMHFLSELYCTRTVVLYSPHKFCINLEVMLDNILLLRALYL